ncbi:MAG: N-acetyl-gamma-glutamyl-phosphate reductase [Parolsenella sp.]|uniref:N-acetyl-gamma-glutamyl-phosphate reductase n=1 Tax=Parolsenella sp. TaxID=2083006 RepID=UPI002E772FE2|nr:N-acetyl-gamma-glutamyl-phosphate reductase [Parolsenella sp.]MEE1372499.1 N-acetyl-gamma-glutamyl-phosphate reductase [Parolsenella sp.]
MSYKVGIIGAAGFAGAELVRLVLQHPEFELAAITSNADAGTLLADVYPAFAGASDLVFTTHDDPAVKSCDLAFLAVPHTAAMAQAPALLDAGVTVVDLSADYRLADKDVYEQWYGAKHTSPELLATRSFGLPELFPEDIERARALRAAGKPALVGCAGCYPTATSIASAPAIRAGWTQGIVIVDAKSGVTGAGKGCNAKTHFCNADEDVQAYNVGKHRHTPEIEQILGKPGEVVFTPHLVPMRRGILSTVYLQLTPEAASMSVEDMVDYYAGFYSGRPFAQVLPAGKLPRTSSVTGTNVCQVGLAKNERTNTLVAIGAIDNLCKGAAGQAVQCANLVFGLAEDTGLARVGMPV